MASTSTLYNLCITLLVLTLAVVLTAASQAEPDVTKDQAGPLIRAIRNFADGAEEKTSGSRQWRLVRRHNTLVPDIGQSSDLTPEDVVWLLGNVGRRRK